jgi:hypothetical protein
MHLNDFIQLKKCKLSSNAFSSHENIVAFNFVGKQFCHRGLSYWQKLFIRIAAARI